MKNAAAFFTTFFTMILVTRLVVILLKNKTYIFEVLHATTHRKLWLSDSEALLLFVKTYTLLPECIQLTLDELGCYYHQVRPKFKYKEILSIIASHHRVRITYSTFRSICKREGLNRKKIVTDRELKKYY